MQLDQSFLPPLGIGDLFGKSARLYFTRLPLFVMISFVPSLVVSLTTIMLFGDDMLGGQIMVGMTALPGIVFMLLSSLSLVLVMSMTTLAANATLQGETIRIGTYLNHSLRYLPQVLLLNLLLLVISYLGLLLLIVPGLYLAARFWVLTPSILIDGASWRGLARASELSRDYRWPLVIVVLLMFVVEALTSLALGLGLSRFALSGFNPFLQAIVQSLVGGIPFSFGAVFTTLLYRRLNELKEGLPIDQLAKVFE